MSGFTSVETINGVLTIVSGPRIDPQIVRVKVFCHLSAPDFRVPSTLFSNAKGSISAEFPSATRLEVYFQFKDDDTSAMTLAETGAFGDWIGQMAGNALALNFAFPCDVFMAVSDKVFRCTDRSGDHVALGEEQDGSDNPALVIMGLKGRLVQVGVTSN